MGYSDHVLDLASRQLISERSLQIYCIANLPIDRRIPCWLADQKSGINIAWLFTG